MRIPLNAQQLKKLLWVAFTLNLAAIFILSAQPAEVSTSESDLFVAVPMDIVKYVRPEKISDGSAYLLIQFLVRKTAHVIEFAALAFWTSALLALYQVRFPYLGAGVFTSLYAASDELHQLFVPGREGKVTDWMFDSFGAVIGALLVFFILRHAKAKDWTVADGT